MKKIRFTQQDIWNLEGPVIGHLNRALAAINEVLADKEMDDSKIYSKDAIRVLETSKGFILGARNQIENSLQLNKEVNIITLNVYYIPEPVETPRYQQSNRFKKQHRRKK